MTGFPKNNTPVGKVIPDSAYTLSGADFEQVLTFISGSAVAVSLPAPGTGGDLYSNWNTTVFAQGAGGVTITPTPPLQGPPPTINGASSLTVPSASTSQILIGSNGNWYGTTYGTMGAAGFDIRLWGADPSGTNDSTAAINAAIASGLPLFVPAGSFKISTLNSPLQGQSITGINPSASQFISNAGTGDILPINNSFVTISNLGILASVGRTAGCHIHIRASSVTIANFYLGAAYCAIQVDDGVSVISIDKGQIVNSVGLAQDVVLFGSGTSTALVATYFGHTVITSSASSLSNITLVNAGDVVLDDIQSLNAVIDLKIAPGTNQSVVTLKCINCYFDHGATNMLVQPSGTGVFARSQFISCWFGSASSNGVVLNPGTSTGVDGISFTNCQFVLAASGAGLIINGNSRNIVVDGGSLIAGNNTGINDNRNAGFNNVIIANSTIGAGGAFAGNVNGYIGQGPGDYLRLINNSLQGNSNVGFSTTNTGTHNIVASNPGYNPVGSTVPSVGASPWTFTNSATPATFYAFGGTISGISINGVALINTAASPWIIPLAANDTVTVTYTGAPTVHVLTQ